MLLRPLVFATGSYPFVPPIDGRNAQGCFVYRTIDDLVADRDWAKNAKVGAVIGGGLLGLEAANALLSPRSRDPRGRARAAPHAGAGRRQRRGRATPSHRGARRQGSRRHRDARGAGRRRDRSSLAARRRHRAPLDMVVFSAGIRPRDELARAAGLEIGPRGGIVVDASCRASDPDIYAIGECALARGQIWGLVAPGYAMAKVVAEVLLGRESSVRRQRSLDQAQAPGRRCRLVRRRARTDARREGHRLQRSRLQRLQEARPLRRRQARPRRHPGRRRDRVRLARADDVEPDAGASAPRRAHPAARHGRRRPRWASSPCPTRP